LHLIYEARQSSLASFIRLFTTQPVIILTMTFTYSATVDRCGFRRDEGDFIIKSFATNFIKLPLMYILSPSF
jgi:hypothetical protein